MITLPMPKKMPRAIISPINEGITLKLLTEALDLALEALDLAVCQAAMASAAFLFKASSLKAAA